MKVVILAGGYGTRISEESKNRPKPMIEICSKPILWHVMRNYYRYGFKEFIICTGYMGNMINAYFANYYLSNCDVTFDFSNNGGIDVHMNRNEDWKVTVVNTGLNTMTGGRIKRIQDYIGNETFMLTYGDGVADINIPELLQQHKMSGNIATVTAVQPSGRFGVLSVDDNDVVERFAEKSREDVDWINGGFMVCEPEVFSYIEGDEIMFEREPMELLVKERTLGVYKHTGFWQCIDTMKDKKILEDYITNHHVPWY